MAGMDATALRQAGSWLWQGLNQLLWPAVCLNCGRWIADADGHLCRVCWGDLLSRAAGNACRRCGRDASAYGMLQGACGACRDEGLHFDGIARAGVYGGVIQELILRFKNGCTDLDGVMATLIRATFDGSGFARDIDRVVAVPLHWRRRLARGYNQSAILAKSLRAGGLSLSADLVRIRHTKQQPAMASPASRRRNVAGAFAVRKGHRFAGRRVCLVDDVKTTGATLNECARVLKEAGAIQVYAVVLAVAGQGN